MDKMAALTSCRCPKCQQSTLKFVDQEVLSDQQVHDRAIICTCCSSEYDVLWGVPFLGVYGQANFFGLTEIAAGAEAYSGLDPATFDFAHCIHLLHEYHLSTDKQSWLRDRAGTIPSWFANRYAEYIAFQVVRTQTPLAGQRVLDVGAGLGFDSLHLVQQGAKVTCFDSCPPLFRLGRQAVPTAQWIGGVTPTLPFANQSFDVVMSNAALHHMEDVPTTIAEMLRVLRPGGTLLTMGDPYRSNSSGEDHVLNVFKDHAGVLQGVNEGIPRIGEFLKTLEHFADRLEIRVFTADACLVTLDGSRTASIPQLREWTLKQALFHLPSSFGSIALQARLKESVRTVLPPLPAEIIRPAEYARSHTDQRTALARIAALAPLEVVDLPINCATQRKYDLLSGWKLPVPGQLFRSCYSRARRFMTNPGKGQFFNAAVLAPHVPSTDKAEFVLCVDGLEIGRWPVQRGLWNRLSARWPERPEGTIASVDLGLVTPINDESSALFHVRHWTIEAVSCTTPSTKADLELYGLSTLAALGLLGKGRISVLLAPDYLLGIEVLNRLRALSLAADVIVVEGQENVFGCEPGVVVRGIYPDRVSSSVWPLTFSVDPILIAAPSVAEAQQFAAMLPAGDRYITTPGGHAMSLQTTSQPPLSVEPLAEVDKLRQIIAAMESTKFWKLRNGWQRVKGFLRPRPASENAQKR